MIKRDFTFMIGAILNRVVVCCVAGIFVGTVPAQQAPPSADALKEISARGRLLAEYDGAAWHATDAVLAANTAKEGGGRYICRKTKAKWTCMFGRLSGDHKKFLVAYEATEGTSRTEFKAKSGTLGQEDTGFYFAAETAVENALQDFGTGSRGRPYNSAVLPTPSGQLYVYLVPAQTAAEIYPLGGDVRYLFSVDGRRVIEKRQLHESILEAKPDRGVVTGFHTHILSDLPEDTDVSYVLMRRPAIPEMVESENYLYSIAVDGTIKILRKK